MARKKWKNWASFALLFIFLIPVFWMNALGTAEQQAFADWQADSSALVLTKIESSRVNASVDSYGLLVAHPDMFGPFTTIDNTDLVESDDVSTAYFDYTSQLGLMGYFYDSAYTAGCSSLNCLTLLSSTLFSLTLASLTFLIAATTCRSFAVIFLLSMALSPWITFAGRNLYWSPWTWLLPVCCAALFVLAKRRIYRVAALCLVFAAFCIRFASGYEFITSFILMAMSIPLLAAIFAAEPLRKMIRRATAESAAILGVSTLAFAVILTIHASVRGAGSVREGFATIWTKDILKRTYGSAADFPPELAASLNANPFLVLQNYIFTWTTDVLTVGIGTPFEIVLGPKSLWVLLGLTAAVVVVRFHSGDSLYVRDLSLIIVTAAIPLSWFILAKGHSYVHTHINFVLWYLFFIAALCFVIFDFVATRAVTKGVTRQVAALRLMGSNPVNSQVGSNRP
ncbi:hypothetical protein E3T43_15930 [Cryobacterium sp. Hh7]|uniref:hypothetical protein n=1 Tax=Cryobacterium sp. Hh7 TaxID=1259159 RepID=UPI00106D6896|nr:hypothetical protein [Cryobacterium sp. Hh7]TFD51773.1 hypothetical protein E3T43_15930 [Cryobacterium sp. Hh7]